MPIYITKFDNESREQFLASDRTLIGSSRISKIVKDGDIVLLFDYNNNEYFGIVIMGRHPNGSMFRENFLPNIQGIYNGKHAKYSRYEYSVAQFYDWNMTCQNIQKILQLNKTLPNNIVKNSNTTGFTKPYYGTKNQPDKEKQDVLHGFKIIVDSVMARS